MLTPDEQHTLYFKENPMGDHNNPSQETIRFMENQRSTNKEVLRMLNEVIIAQKEDRVTMKNLKSSLDGYIKRTEDRIVVLEDTEKTYITMWEAQKEERADTKKKVIGYAWKVVMGVAVLLFGKEGLGSLLDKF
jgi:hypothetical protein